MNAQEIIKFIADAKKDSVKVTLTENCTVPFLGPAMFSNNAPFLLKPPVNWKKIRPMSLEQDARNPAVPILDKSDINARIEPGVAIR